ncbi:MAG: hypothetical protein Q8927_17770 [Bacteroidota bacterium]|nr:hypothetical protein [Bacteroidota bacterium]MDP4218055.1 hypothetical protein [Bacteroidota bacterium]MDP4254189.1 hypothetical protein [Bacteroidota bacterium]MDP4257629.1 hypothetical protein [Bacteroidota bacterium]
MRRAVVLMFIAFLLNGCKKSHSDPATITIPDLPPAVTAVGTPIASPVTKTIGPGGGTVLSADGRIELSLPVNALAANTDITIQPVTNTAPNGSGVSYHLMPDGTKFNVPVTLTFHYSAADVNGTLPVLFYIAFQDSSGIWQADFKNRKVDTAAKTASLSIRHFSFWSLGSQLYMFASPPQVSENEQSNLGIVIVNDEGDPGVNSTGEFGLSSLPAVTPVPGSVASNWAINGIRNGNSQVGTLSGSESAETYTAPGTISQEHMVQASATLTYPMKGWSNGKAVMQTNKFILFTDINLLPRKMSFKVDVLLQIINTSEVYNDLYSDGASFQVDLDHGKVTVGHFSNEQPNVTPPTGSYGLIQATWTNDGTGLVNITQGLGVFEPTTDTIAVYLAHTGTVTPIWKTKDISTGITSTYGGEAVPGYPSGLFIIARDSVQEGGYSNGGTLSATWTITPIH